jgi:CheY-like chemotaxis protein
MSAKRALIVDDSRSARTFLTRILERYDLEVDGAGSAEEAIDYLGRQRPDVIFLDHLMPGMDGFEALTAIKNDPRTATIPVMMYTSQEGELYLSQARALGAMGVLPKQTRPADVSRALEQLRLLGERRPESEIATVRVPSLREFPEPAAPPAPDAATAPTAGAGLPEADAHHVEQLLRRSTPAGAAGLTPEMRAQLESILRDHGTELRRFVARSLAQQSGQIIKEVRTLLESDEAEPHAAPTVEVRAPGRDSGANASWLAAGAAFLALLAVLLWYRANTGPATVAGAAPSVAPAAGAAATAAPGRGIAATEAVPKAGAAPRASTAPLLVASVPFGDSPFSGARIDAVQGVLARLVATGYRGSVEIRSYPGRFCLQGSGDTVTLPPPELSYAKCDQLGNPVDNAGVAGRESVAFANMLSALRSRSRNAFEVTLTAGSADEVATPYPLVTAFLTTGEWNRAAAANNRVEVRARPAP